MFSDATLAAALVAHGEAMIAPPDAVLFESGERADGVYVVVSGAVDVAMLNGDGKEMWSTTAVRGVVLGVPAAVSGRGHSYCAVAWNRAEIVFVSADKLCKLIRDNVAIGNGVLRLLSEEVRLRRG